MEINTSVRRDQGSLVCAETAEAEAAAAADYMRIPSLMEETPSSEPLSNGGS